ncbi:MAG: glycosyltransferase family 4 protein [Pirellulales bacterium]
MNHLIICREYPPARGGGIGTYTHIMAHALAACGERVHVLGQRTKGAEMVKEILLDGRLAIHRLPYDDWTVVWGQKPSRLLSSPVARKLFESSYPPEAFSWEVNQKIQEVLLEESIDLIEAPEYEAPLYHFQLQRAQATGQVPGPPCLVHLHSPSELIAKHNVSEGAGTPRFKSHDLEAYSVLAADGLVCPSRYVANQVTELHQLEPTTITVIPLPMPVRPVLERAERVWCSGGICYVGRLERRKGVLEWIEAAVAMAEQNEQLRFDFVGDIVLDTERELGVELLRRLIPRGVRRQFHFHGHKTHAEVAGFLAEARIAVVPSRWENFPYACLEAMASGLPVVVSPHGGMVEMVDDGVSGWVAASSEPTALADALRRALSVSPLQLQEMGCASAQRVRDLCDTKRVVEQQLVVRRKMVEAGARNVTRERLEPVVESTQSISAVNNGRVLWLLVRSLLRDPFFVGRLLVKMLVNRVRGR